MKKQRAGGKHPPSDYAIRRFNIADGGKRFSKRWKATDMSDGEYYGKPTKGDVRLLQVLLIHKHWAELTSHAKELYVQLRLRACYPTKEQEHDRLMALTVFDGPLPDYEALPPWFVIPEYWQVGWAAKNLGIKEERLKDEVIPQLLNVGLIRIRMAKLKKHWGYYVVVYETIDEDRCMDPDPEVWDQIIEREGNMKVWQRRFDHWCVGTDGKEIGENLVTGI